MLTANTVNKYIIIIRLYNISEKKKGMGITSVIKPVNKPHYIFIVMKEVDAQTAS